MDFGYGKGHTALWNAEEADGWAFDIWHVFLECARIQPIGGVGGLQEEIRVKVVRAKVDGVVISLEVAVGKLKCSRLRDGLGNLWHHLGPWPGFHQHHRLSLLRNYGRKTVCFAPDAPYATNVGRGR